MVVAHLDKPVIGILPGDAAGVGPELVARLVADGFPAERCRPVILADRCVLELGMRRAGVSFRYREIASAAEADFSGEAQLVAAGSLDPAAVVPGEAGAASGKAAGEAILKAIEMCRKGELEGFVFAPFNTASLRMAGFRFESELYLFAHYFGVTTPFGEVSVLGDFMTSRVTGRIPLRDVPGRMTGGNVLRVIHLLDATLKRYGVDRARLGVAGLNPHGGENGSCGREEIDVISPAVEEARNQGIDAVGPLPSDTLFLRAFGGEFNAVVAMYHDQDQIALGLKGFGHGVTVAGGMPYPIATPARGALRDAADGGAAGMEAFRNAVRVVARMAGVGRAGGGRAV